MFPFFRSFFFWFSFTRLQKKIYSVRTFSAGTTRIEMSRFQTEAHMTSYLFGARHHLIGSRHQVICACKCCDRYGRRFLIWTIHFELGQLYFKISTAVFEGCSLEINGKKNATAILTNGYINAGYLFKCSLHWLVVYLTVCFSVCLCLRTKVRSVALLFVSS